MTIIEHTITTLVRLKIWWFNETHMPFIDIEKMVEIYSWPDELFVEKLALYLRRWFLWETPEGSWYLHRIVRSDDDADPHDHPWSFKSRILWNGYDDVSYVATGAGRMLYNIEKTKFGCVYSRPAEHCHQVKLRCDKQGHVKEAWTLVFVSKYDRKREWGFMLEDGTWVKNQTYLGIPDDGTTPFDRTEKQW